MTLWRTLKTVVSIQSSVVSGVSACRDEIAAGTIVPAAFLIDPRAFLLVGYEVSISHVVDECDHTARYAERVSLRVDRYDIRLAGCQPFE